MATYFALAKHGGENSRGIFPSWGRLRALTGGQSKERLWKSLNVLRACNVIIWDRGSTGISNNYSILGSGAWRKKQPVDKSRKRVDNFPRVVRQTNHPGSPSEPPVVRQTNPNHPQLNHAKLSGGKSLTLVGDNFKPGSGIGDLVAKARKKVDDPEGT